MISRALCPVLVGREGELSRSEDALLAALRGEGSVIALAGDAGIGKTRLCAEVEARARKLGAAVLRGSCSEADLALPYLPFLEAIGNFLETADVEALRERLGLGARQLGNLFPRLSSEPLPAGDATEAKLRLFEAILALLGEVARESGLLLIIEDLHWADASTRELVDYVTRRVRNSRMLVMATYRRDEMHRKHPLLPTIQGWQRARLAEVVELDPLPPDGVRRMVSAIFDDTQVGEEFRDFMHRRTEGNPFVVEEMLKAALDRGDIFRTDEGWDRRPISQLQIPETVRDTILLRLERLDETQADILRAAAVMGRSFDHQLLARVVGVEREQLESALQAATMQQLIEEEAGAGYRFRHALTQEAIYEDLSAPKRERLHAAIAEALPEQAAAERARHLLSAHRIEEAVPAALAAAEAALKGHGYEEAALLFEAILPAVTDMLERGRMLCRAGQAWHEAANYGRAIGLLDEGIRLLEGKEAEIEAASYRLVLGRCHWMRKQHRRAGEEYERARIVLERDGPSAALAAAYIRLAGLRIFEVDPDGCRELAEKATAIASEAGADDMRIWALNFIGSAAAFQGDSEAGVEYLERSFSEAVQRGLLWIAANALHNAAIVYWDRLELDRALSVVPKLRALPVPQWRDRTPPWIEGITAMYRGDVRAMLAAADAATSAGWESVASVLLCLGLAEQGHGELALARLKLPSDDPELQDLIGHLHPLVLAKLARDDFEGARRELAWLFERSDQVSRVAPGRQAAFWLTYVATPREAERLALLCERTATAEGLAFAAAIRGRTERDRTRLQQAIETFDRTGCRLYAARCRLWLAEVLGGGAEARALVENVIATARGCGSAFAERQAFELAQKLELGLSAPSVEASPPQAPEAVGERLVTVMFADVRGYTAMTGERPPAEMTDRIAAYQRWAAQEIERERGVVDKFAGDAVMSIFNVSGDQVDHAAHALRAARALRDKAALLDLPVGIGMATGPAVVGKLKEGANLSVLGETTNLAARLQAAAGLGEILLSEEARRRLPDLNGAEREELTLKGFERPVPVYRLR